MKTCSYCCSEVEDEDSFCRYCGRKLVTPGEVPPGQSTAGNGMAIHGNAASHGFWDTYAEAVSWWFKALLAGSAVYMTLVPLFGRHFWSVLPGNIVAISIVLLGARRAGQKQNRRSQGCLTISAAFSTLFIFIDLFQYLAATPSP